MIDGKKYSSKLTEADKSSWTDFNGKLNVY